MKKSLFKSLMFMALLCMSINVCSQTLTPQKDAKKPLWGYVDESGNWVIKPNFTAAGEFTKMSNGKSSAIVENKGKKGVINSDGSYLIKPDYSDIAIDTLDYIVVNQKGKAGVFTVDGQLLIEPKKYTNIDIDGDLWGVSVGNLKGIYDPAKNKEVIKPQYTEFKEGFNFGDKYGVYYIVIGKDGKYGLVNTYGAEKFRQNYAKIEYDQQFGFFATNSNGSQRLYSPGDNIWYDVKTLKNEKIGNCTLSSKEFVKEGSNQKSTISYLIDKDGNQTKLNEYTDFKTFPGIIVVGRNEIQIFTEDGKYLGDLKGKYDFKVLSSKNTDYLVGHPDRWDKAAYDMKWIADKQGNVYKFVDKISTDVGVYHCDANNKDIMLYFAKFDFRNGSTDLTINDTFDAITVDGDNLNIKKDGKWASVNNPRGYEFAPEQLVFKSVVEEEWDKLADNSTLYKTLDNGRYGLRKNDKTLLPSEYTKIEYDPYNSKEGFIKVWKNDSVGCYDCINEKWILPADLGFTGYWYVSGVPLVRAYKNEHGGDRDVALWNYKLQKQVMAPKKDSSSNPKIDIIEYNNKYIFGNGEDEWFTAEGKKLALTPSIELISKENVFNAIVNGPKYVLQVCGMKNRKIIFTITYYHANGTPCKFPSGKPVVTTDTVDINKNMEWVERKDDNAKAMMSVPGWSRRDFYSVLTAKDAKTGAAIPIKGNTKVEFALANHSVVDY